MLDLETLSTVPEAAILSIGAVFFDPINSLLGKEFYQIVVRTNSTLDGTVSDDTVKWWNSQSPEANSIFTDPSAISLREALVSFDSFIKNNGSENIQVWGNGSGFDNVILASAYKRNGLKVPWNFRNDRDVRTVVELGRCLRKIDPKESLTMSGLAHNALDDAKFQAQYVNSIFSALKNS
ncbi:MAG: 3'-5' exoribonuclease [Shewanella sp.]|nr:3'-5' exoribonuclease [Shewanella sp.]